MDKKQAMGLCMCKGCPSFFECKEKIAFCFNGKSKCIRDKQGCICGNCPVHKEMGLENYYFCMAGKGKTK